MLFGHWFLIFEEMSLHVLCPFSSICFGLLLKEEHLELNLKRGKKDQEGRGQHLWSQESDDPIKNVKEGECGVLC